MLPYHPQDPNTCCHTTLRTQTHAAIPPSGPNHMLPYHPQDLTTCCHTTLRTEPHAATLRLAAVLSASFERRLFLKWIPIPLAAELDPALIRPGRINRKILMGYLYPDEVRLG